MLPRWPRETAVIIGGGPSLTREDVEYVRGKARVLVLNRAWELAPWADWLHGSDARWWHRWPEAWKFDGFKTGVWPEKHQVGARMQRLPACVLALQATGRIGFDASPLHVRTGMNGCYQAIHALIHTGVGLVALLGIDMKRGEEHWHEPHEWQIEADGSVRRIPWETRAPLFKYLLPTLRCRGIEVVNCSPDTALPEEIFPKAPLRAVL